MKINMAQLERELTAHFASVLGMTIDHDIFRGGIPDGVSEGVAVMISSEVVSKHIDFPTFRIQVIGKFYDRDVAFELVAKLRESQPVNGRQMEEYIIVSLISEGDIVAPYQAFDGGEDKHCVSFNAEVSILTSHAGA